MAAAPAEPTGGAAARVVHVVGPLSEQGVQTRLWPAVLALAQAGARQTLLLLDPADATRAGQLQPAGTELVVLTVHRPRWSHGEVLRALRERLAPEGVLAVHLHGELGRNLGLRAMRGGGAAVPVFLHESAGQRAAWPLRWWRRVGPRPTPHTLVVRAGRIEPFALRRDAPPSMATLAPFFQLERRETPPPTIVTTARRNDFVAASAFAQLAVLFAGSLPKVRFVWLGEAGPAVSAVLQAAQVQQVRARRPLDRARWLGEAWVYVAPAGRDHETRGLVEAMAAGVPCVARDGMALADRLIIDQLSGYVCPDQQTTLARIAGLVDDGGLRASLGAAARERVRLHHGQDEFRDRLLLAHGFIASGTA
jgi:hypothetical protein